MNTEGLVGRDTELAELTALLERPGAAVVLCGAPGIGKSRLLAEVARRAAGAGRTVLWAHGVQSETTVAHTGLHQLLHPLLGRSAELPQRQAEALRTLFGRDEGPAPDPLLIRLGVLSLLEEAAQRSPVLLAVDDVHWLDRPTAEVLTFVIDRLDSAPIGLLATLREGDPDPLAATGARQREITALSPQSAAALLDAAAEGLSPAVRARILDAALGNPLALLELPRAQDAARPDPAPRPVPLTQRLEHVFGDRLTGLPQRCRELLLLAAADDADAAEGALWRAAAGRGLTAADLAPAEAAGVVTVQDGAVRFRHPLMRAAAYSLGSLTERGRAHRALAAALPDDPDRAAWHLAAATLGRDESVAARLEQAGDRYRGRGAMSAAMSAYERAARLSTSPGTGARRLGLAADAGLRAGDRAAAARLIAEATALSSDPVVAAGLALPEYFLRITTGSRGRDADELIELARQVGGTPLQPMVIAIAAMDAWTTLDLDGKRERVERELLAMDLDPADPNRVMALAVVAPERHAAELTPLVRVLARQAVNLGQHYLMMGLGGAAEALRLLPVAELCHRAAVDSSRQDGSLTDHCMSLIRYAALRLAAGDLTEALTCAEQSRRLGTDLGLPIAVAGAAAISARVYAWRGDADAANEALRAVTGHLGRAGQTPGVAADAAWASGLLALAEGRAADAVEDLLAVVGHRDWGAGFMVGDLAEAAHRAGDADISEAVAAAAAEAAVFDSGLLRHLVLRARALSGDGDAGRLFREAVAAAGEHRHPLEWARTRLAYGEWLRRDRQPVLARTQLTAASTAFLWAGAAPWARRAQSELRAAGGLPGRAHGDPMPGALRALTPQELQISRLAASGLSNREIADQLFLSPRTVGVHLYRSYPKLGVRNRAELAKVFATPPTAG
ncbi:AAA family ATPase [Actinoplanes sp. NPDC024001]|uniref:helix-turn-helix transcriptional regulator n=1 Tax=Actinoplanes sp. NPDC024001 TaxID=3154598 RepID=UPI0033F40FA0